MTGKQNMQRKIEAKVREYCNRYSMLKKNDSVVVGVSGGADSVCLLFVLLALREEFELKLHVVHVNHGIRADAGEDAAYVKALCTEYELPFYLVERDIPAEAAALNCSEEEAGRRARYQAFSEIQKKQHCQKIAVAHNSNDRAETMLFHLFRGTGLTGLAGIRPVREGIIRPILCLERAEIEGYLAERGIAYRHDSTNDSDDYTRNRIRHHILPYAQEQIAGGCVANMTRTADILAETENYIEEQVQEARLHCLVQEKKDGFVLDRESFLQQHGMIQKRILLQLLKQLSPMQQDITALHIEKVLTLFTEEGNRCIHLPYGIRCSRVYGRICLERGQEEKILWPAVQVERQKLALEECRISLQGCGEICLKSFLRKAEDIKIHDIPQNKYTKWLDYDKIKEYLEIRTRQVGDYLCMKSGEGLQHQKLKDYMINEKIPRQERDRVPVLAEGSHILWLVGYRISEYYKVSENTEHILQITYEPYDAE